MEHRKFSFLYRLYFFGLINLTIFISIILAILRPFSLSTVTWNGQELTGVMAYVLPFIVSIVFSLVLALLLAFFAWVGYKIFSHK